MSLGTAIVFGVIMLGLFLMFGGFDGDGHA